MRQDTNERTARAAEIKSYPKKQLVDIYTEMLLIRRFEEKTAEMYTRAKIGGFVHLNIGEEAAIVGSISALGAEDYLFSSYRDHGHAIARGVPPEAVMAELYGREGGTSKGRGGSMHLIGPEKRFMGGYAIVGGFVPIAAGVALAMQYEHEKSIVMAIIGDGATNIGAFHEGLNVAALWKLPLLLIIINNQYGMGTSVPRASAVTELWKKGCAYGIDGERVDGMNVLSVRESVVRAVDRVRSERKPYIIEEVAYRYRGHSMSDPAIYRTDEEVEKWKRRDPIQTFGKELIDAGMVSQKDLDEIEKSVEKRIAEVVQFADQSPEPDVKDLYKYVYAGELEVK